METTETDMELFRSYMSDPSARAAFMEFKAQHEEQETPRHYARILHAVGSRPWAIE